jgi:hypothetical protein
MTIHPPPDLPTSPPARTALHHERDGWHWWRDVPSGALVLACADRDAGLLALEAMGYTDEANEGRTTWTTVS